MTKASIVQRLLDKKQISAEEAVVLLKEPKGDTLEIPQKSFKDLREIPQASKANPSGSKGNPLRI